MAIELDKAALLENFMDDEELLFESIDLFSERIGPRMNTLKEAILAQDINGYMHEAHTIKGMIGIFSTGEVFEAAKKLETKGREHSTLNLEDDFKVLDDLLNQLLDFLRQWRLEA
ncbi:MAG: Hpt domain-containing protein [Candidatus Adiutrix sp.]